MEILITICARGGSKGIPGKNIKFLGGIPLIGYSINHAKEFVKEFGGDVVLSSDSEEIRKTANDLGLHSEYRRPDFLATDSIGKMDVINDVLNYMEEKEKKKYDYVLDLDVTSPLRNLRDLKEAFFEINSNKHAINIFSVSPAQRNPYFNMVEAKNNGFVSLVKDGQFTTRQSTPKVYDLNASFYFYKRVFFEKEYKTVITNASLIYEVDHLCFDLDEIIDFTIMEYLISNDLLDFDL